MRRIKPTNVLSFTVADDLTPILLLDGEPLPDDEDVTWTAGGLASWIKGVFVIGAPALVQARDALNAEARSRSN